MATEIPGQIEHLVQEDRLTTPIWYEWFAYIRRFVRNAEGSWTAFTPTMGGSVGGSGTITNNGCRYRRTGKTVDVAYDVTITSIGSSSGTTVLSLPIGPATRSAALIGREMDITGNTLVGTISVGGAATAVVYYNNTSVLAINLRINLGGTYEV